MTNSYEKNWLRLLGTIDGFRLKHQRWPTRIYLHAAILDDLQQQLFTAESFAKLAGKLEFSAREDAWLIAADEAGNEYSFNKEGLPKEAPDMTAAEWLAVCPDR